MIDFAERHRDAVRHGEILAQELAKARVEIERLREQLWSDDELEHEIALCRDNVIEECARVAESCEPTPDGDDPYCQHQIAAAIRTLKDKP